MKISFKCPVCSAFLQGDEVYSGKWIECPSCGNIQIMPDSLLPADTAYYNYKIIKLSYRNSIWATYKAQSLKNNKQDVIIKVIESYFKQNIADFNKFCEKIVELGHLDLSCSPQLIDKNTDIEKPFFVFSDMKNSRSLASMIKDKGLITQDDALNIALIIIEALQEMHTYKNIIHHCINPRLIRFSPSLDIIIYENGLHEFLLNDTKLKEAGFNILKTAFLHPDYSRDIDFNIKSLSKDIIAIANIIFLILNKNLKYPLLDINLNEPIFSEQEISDLDMPSQYKKLLNTLSCPSTQPENWNDVIDIISKTAYEYEMSKREIGLLMSVLQSIPDIPEPPAPQINDKKDESEIKADIAKFAKLKIQEKRAKKKRT